MAIIIKTKPQPEGVGGNTIVDSKIRKDGAEDVVPIAEKRLIIARASSEAEEYAKISHPIFRNFAYKCNADFMVLTTVGPDANFTTDKGRMFYRTFKSADFLKIYDRILILDSDMLLSPNCPNIFDEVPADMLGVVMEDKGTRADSRLSRMQDAQRTFGDIGWSSGYPNSGFMIFSKGHENIFSDINGHYWEKMGFDCVHMGYNIKKYNIPYIDLGYRWNHMTMFSEEWNGFPNRFESNVIHYAGIGIFDLVNNSRLEQMSKDKEHWWGKG